MYEYLAGVRGQEVGDGLAAALARHLQHDRAAVEEKIDEARGGPAVDVDRGDPVHGRAVLQLAGAAAARRAPLQGDRLVLAALVEAPERLDEGRVLGVACRNERERERMSGCVLITQLSNFQQYAKFNRLANFSIVRQ